MKNLTKTQKLTISALCTALYLVVMMLSLIHIFYETPHPFPLSTTLGTLAGGLGCFPFDHGSYHS